MDKKLQIPHILQIGSSSWQDQVELPAGLGLALFQATTLPSLKEYMEEEGNLQIQSLDSRKARRFISFRRRPSLFSALYRFL